jgi:adenylate kinase family enzyme
MRRVAIIGCPGAGKSTFARAMAARTGLPIIHLDRLSWTRGWVPAPRTTFVARRLAALAEERGIVDGHYGATPSTSACSGRTPSSFSTCRAASAGCGSCGAS